MTSPSSKAAATSTIMKRAAGQIRKVRNKTTGKGDKESSNNHHGADPHTTSSNNNNGGGQPLSQNNNSGNNNNQPAPSVRRKPTNEEAALTAKNYRLAKELVRFVDNFFR